MLPGEGEGVGAKSYNGKKAFSSINHSLLSVRKGEGVSACGYGSDTEEMDLVWEGRLRQYTVPNDIFLQGLGEAEILYCIL